MTAKISQFLAVIFTAFALIPGGAHLMALPAKIDMPEHPYFVVQQIYGGWAWLGILVFAALFANLCSAMLARQHPRQFWLSLTAALLIATALVIFFVWTYPANQATGNWTSAPTAWEQLRAQWEYSHAVNAVVTFVALLCSVGSALSGETQSVAARTSNAETARAAATRDAALGAPDTRIMETRSPHLRRPIDVA